MVAQPARKNPLDGLLKSPLLRKVALLLALIVFSRVGVYVRLQGAS
jgi:hypothetical protein